MTQAEEEMLFCSNQFIFYFLPIVILIYFLVPMKFKNICLFIASLIFYAVGEMKYVPLILLSLTVNYFAAIFIRKFQYDNQILEHNGEEKNNYDKITLIVALVYNFLFLFVFKYFTFFTGIETSLTLPLGISFYTFQIASYVIDVYTKKTKAEKNYINLGVYLCMFPQLIAGPIVVYKDIAKQIRKRKVSLLLLQDGIRIFIMGLASKMLLANIMGMCWESIKTYGIASISTPMAWIAMFAYTFQIYFDFYGYSLMAIGLGKMLGFKIPRNFNNPYISTSVTEFWRRWHITLGSWFRDYVYIPLGGNRKGFARTIFNMFVVWGLTGLWHGASWNFVCWGLLFFVLLTIEKLGLKNILDKYPALGHLYIIFIIPMSWMVFALDKMGDIKLYFAKLFPMISHVSTEFVNKLDYVDAIKHYGIFFVFAVIFSLSIPMKIFEKYRRTKVASVILIIIFWVCVYRMSTAASNPFLYFRF